MGRGFRYKVEHIGDSFADMMGKASDVARSSLGFIGKIKLPDVTKSSANVLKKVSGTAKGSARGVILTYDIHDLERKKERIIKQIGRRIVDSRKVDPDLNVSNDEILTDLFSSLDDIESRLRDCTKERNERLYLIKSAPEDLSVETKEATVEEPVTEEQAEAVEGDVSVEEQADATVEEPATEEQAKGDEGEASSEGTTEGDADEPSSETQTEDKKDIQA